VECGGRAGAAIPLWGGENVAGKFNPAHACESVVALRFPPQSKMLVQCLALPQRGYVIQPSVGAKRLRWVRIKRNHNPNGVVAEELKTEFNPFWVDEMLER